MVGTFFTGFKHNLTAGKQRRQSGTKTRLELDWIGLDRDRVVKNNLGSVKEKTKQRSQQAGVPGGRDTWGRFLRKSALQRLKRLLSTRARPERTFTYRKWRAAAEFGLSAVNIAVTAIRKCALCWK
ncbi:hypothetical protein J6590_044918 [Homalodisca vitripennis]|nr:hypothetical protein J6590_044918 [Homalodisca vitripennis]